MRGLRRDAGGAARPSGQHPVAGPDGRAARGRGRLLRTGHRAEAGVGTAVTRKLGRSTVEVSALGLGTAPIGNLYAAVEDERAAQTIDAAWTAGIPYFDTAPHYGLGLAERRLG